MQIQWWDRAGVEVRGDCAAARHTRPHAPISWLPRKSSKSVDGPPDSCSRQNHSVPNRSQLLARRICLKHWVSGYFCYLNSRGTYCAELRAGLTRRWGSYENRSPLSKWLSLPAPWRMVRPIPPASLERGWLLQPRPRFQTFGALQRLSQYF